MHVGFWKMDEGFKAFQSSSFRLDDNRLDFGVRVTEISKLSNFVRRNLEDDSYVLSRKAGYFR